MSSDASPSRVFQNRGDGIGAALPDSGRAAPSTALTPEEAAREERANIALEAVGQGSNPTLEALRGSRYLLDYLDELEPTHPARAGLRVELEHVGQDGVTELVPACWDADLPTYSRLGGRVASGLYKPGDYRVVLRKLNKTLPHIRMRISPMAVGGHVPQPGAGDGSRIDDALRLFEAMKATTQGDTLQASVAELVAAINNQEARIVALEEQAQNTADAIREAEDATREIVKSGGSMSPLEMLQMVMPLFEQLKGGAAVTTVAADVAPADAPADGWTGVG